MTNCPNFSTDQRKRLARLGVTPEQVAELIRVLPSVAASGKNPPKLADVRAPLEKIRDTAAILARDIARVSSHRDDRALSMAAFLLWDAHGQRLHDDYFAAPLEPRPRNLPPDKLAKEIKRLAEIADDALKRIAGKQTRHRIADPQPVSLIDHALLEGWNKTHSAHLSDDDLRNGDYPPLPEYPFGPGERGHRAKFRKIVEICYQASGHPNADPERATKAYAARERVRFADLFEWTEAGPSRDIGIRKDGRSKK